MHDTRARYLLLVVISNCLIAQRGVAEKSPAGVEPIDLRCEHLVDPLGIDDLRPRLSWKLVATNKSQRNQRQSAYQILVASDRPLLEHDDGDLWDTGRVPSERCHLVPYEGKPLQSRMQCWWKVRVWDEQGCVSSWSPVAHWSMGLLTPAAWKDARWIGLKQNEDPGIETTDIKAANWLWYPEGNASVDAPVETRFFRRRVALPADRSVVRAICFFAGDDAVSFYVNGTHVGVGRGHPNLMGADLTGQLKPGVNELGAAVTNGNANVPANPAGWIGALRVEFDKGAPLIIYSDRHWKCTKGVREGWQTADFKEPEWVAAMEQTVVTDDSWKLTADGPLRASNEFDGEEYDARLEISGWNAPGFDDSTWQAAQIVESPGGQLESQMIEPIRVTEVLKPVRLVQPRPDIWMVDFGQAFYGVVRVKVTGPEGTRVTMRTSFNVLPDGTLNTTNDRSAKNTDIYILKGDGVETWHPRFRGNATRWVQVEGFPGTPTEDSFAGLVTHTDHDLIGEFACSNELINRIYRNARWGTRLQNRSVPMEPDRDERMPWSGHPAKTSESEGWAFNVARFYEHFLHNYRVHQGDDGSLQEILPPYWRFNSKDIIWPSVVTIIPDWYYNFYGDERLFRDNYDMMRRFVLYHERTNLKSDNTMDHCNYGDWVDTASIGANSRNFGATSRPLMGTAYLYNNCRILERAARIVGKPDDEEYFAKLANRIRVGFNQRFFDAETGTYESKTQCSFVLPLAFGLVPEEHRDQVVENLVRDIVVTHNGHTSVGLIGTQWQMQVLTDIGRPDVAYRIATRTERPSWGYMISKGATTIWERWDTDTQDGGMNGESQKILSGNFEAWCYQTLGGINYDRSRPGFKHIILRPRPVGDLTWARASHVSAYGRIESEWKLGEAKIRWRVVVPPNTTATAYIPTTSPDRVRESGQPIDQVPGVRLMEKRSAAALTHLGSGTYEFTAPFRK